MENSITFHHHHNKIKFGVVSVIAVVLIYLGFTSVTSYFSYYGNGQCRDVFDNQPLENRQKICCNMDHYNSSDSLCKIKCDAIDVNPESAFCQNLKKNQTQSPIAQEIQKAVPLPKSSPKCSEFKVINYDTNEKNNLLKPSNPLNFQMNVQAKDIQPSYFIYEFYTIEGNDIYSIKPISFEKGKNFMAVNPVKYVSSGLYTDALTVFHNFFYKENLNDNKKQPKDILVVTSIIDENGNKQLQPASCFGRFSVDPTPDYCKSFKLDSDTLKKDKKIKLSIESNSPTIYSYEFKFFNMKNFETSNGNKEYKPISFEKVNNENEPYEITKLANGNSKLSFELDWESFKKKDLNYKNKYASKIRVEAYIKPASKTSLDELVPCKAEFEIDEGILNNDYCKEVEVNGGTRNSDGSITLKPTQYLTIKSTAKVRDIIRFDYVFYNLDNLISSKKIDDLPNANNIFFDKGIPYAMIRDSSKTDSKSVLVSYDDLNKIDLPSGKKPKNIQVRAFFNDSNNYHSKADPDCSATIRME